jgi:hypothetical protein
MPIFCKAARKGIPPALLPCAAALLLAAGCARVATEPLTAQENAPGGSASQGGSSAPGGSSSQGGSFSQGASSASANLVPNIGGTPATSVNVDAIYSFVPVARDDNGDSLAFSIENKPAWATFSLTTGRLSGTPVGTDVGVYAGITIRVSDGRGSATLPAFTLIVQSAGGNGNGNGNANAGTTPGNAVLAWSAPAQNTDGSALTDLAGYWIYHGTRNDNLVRVHQISDPANTQYIATGLASGTHFFAVTAFNTANVESIFSAVGSKNVP